MQGWNNSCFHLIGNEAVFIYLLCLFNLFNGHFFPFQFLLNLELLFNYYDPQKIF